ALPVRRRVSCAAAAAAVVVRGAVAVPGAAAVRSRVGPAGPLPTGRAPSRGSLLAHEARWPTMVVVLVPVAPAGPARVRDGHGEAARVVDEQVVVHREGELACAAERRRAG